jgi:cell division protein FtsW
MLYCLITGVLLFVAGARWRHFALFGLVGVLALGTLAVRSGHVRDRMRAFAGSAQPAAERQRVGLQQDQSKIAVGSGGAFGVGLGRGNQQRGWLPLPYNDFIGSVIGEEFGFAGLAFCTVAFAIYGFLGFRIAEQARTPYLGLLAVGLTTVTVVTALVHLAVVVDALPNTGLTLPFVSYGRSNLVLTLAMTGILVNIGSTRERVYGAGATDPLAGPRTRAALA